MFNYSIVEKNEIQIISFRGNILGKENLFSFFKEIDTLFASGKKKLIANFSNVDYINSSGLNLLITLLNKSRNNYGEFYICNIPFVVMRLIAISKLESIFKIEDNLEKALQKFK
jgi:anti-sigma B factor antagonist